MVRLGWGTFLGIVLPGIPVLVGLARLEPKIAAILATPEGVGVTTGVGLLLLTTLAGGVLDAVRRCLIDVLMPPTEGSIFQNLTVANLPLFEAGVENSYRYYAFYANLALGVLFLFLVRLASGDRGVWDVLLVITGLIAVLAARAQYRFYLRFANGFIAEEQRRRTREEEDHAS